MMEQHRYYGRKSGFWCHHETNGQQCGEILEASVHSDNPIYIDEDWVQESELPYWQRGEQGLPKIRESSEITARQQFSQVTTLENSRFFRYTVYGLIGVTTILFLVLVVGMLTGGLR